MPYNPAVVDEYLQQPGPPPDEVVGRPDVGYNVDVVKEYMQGGPPDSGPAFTPPDPTESVGEDTTKKRNPFGEAAFSAAQGVINTPFEAPPEPSPTFAAATPVAAPDEAVGKPEGPAHDETVGQPEPNPAQGAPGGWLGFVKDAPNFLSRDLPFTNAARAVYEDVTDGHGLKSAAKGIPGAAFESVGNFFDIGKRMTGVLAAQGASTLDELRSNWESGNYIKPKDTPNALRGDVVPYILGGQPYTMTAPEFRAYQHIADDPLSAFVPGQGGSGAGPTLPFAIGPMSDSLYDFPIVGGGARTLAGFNPVAIAHGAAEGPSLDVPRLVARANQGATQEELAKEFPGNPGLKPAGELLNVFNALPTPAGVEARLAETAGKAMGYLEGPGGRVLRDIFSAGSLAKTDMRAVPDVAARFAGSQRAADVAQAMADHVAAPEYTRGQALRDLFTGGKGTVDQDVRIADAAGEKFAKDYAAETLAAGAPQRTLKDFIAEQLTPTQAAVEADMKKAGLTQADYAANTDAYAGRFVRTRIQEAAEDTLALRQLNQVSGSLAARFVDYMRTGTFTPTSALGRTVEDVRTGVASGVKTGLLAFSPRYYLQNLVDNSLHAALGGGYAKFENPITKGLEERVSGINGVRGTRNMPNYIKDQFGINADTGVTFTGQAAQQALRTNARRAGIGEVLRTPARAAGKVLETLGNPVEQLPRQSLWSRIFFRELDTGYRGLIDNLRATLGANAHPEVRRVADDFIAGLSDGRTTSFDRAREVLNRATVNDPAAQATLRDMRRILPDQVDQINTRAGLQGYREVNRVFNNYDLHIKYIDTFLNSLFLFSKYQTRSLPYLAGTAVSRPGLVAADVRFNQAMRDANAQSRPGLPPSAQEKIYFGDYGINPADVFPLDKSVNAIRNIKDAVSGNRAFTPDTSTLRQDPLSKAARVVQEFGGPLAGLGQFSLPAQAFGERVGALPPGLTNVTEQPFINYASRIPLRFDVPAFNVPGVSVGGQPVSFGGGEINPARIAATALSPAGLAEKALTAITGRETSNVFINNQTEKMMATIVAANPSISKEAAKEALRAQSGPLYDQARQMALDYAQESRNFNAFVPTSTRVLMPNEVPNAAMQQAYGQGIDAAKAVVAVKDQAYNDAIYTRDPVQIARAKRESDEAHQALGDAFGAPNPSLNVDTAGTFEGRYFPGRGPEDPNYRTVSKALDENGVPTQYNVSENPSGYTRVGADRYVLNTQMGQNPAQDYLRKNGFPDAVLANPVNPYSPGAIALRDVVRESQQGFTYRDPRTGVVSNIPGEYGSATAYAHKPGVTEQQAADFLQQQRAFGAQEDIQTGRGLSPADRAALLAARERENAAGQRVVTGIDGAPTTVVADLGKPGGYYETQQKAFGASGSARQRLFDQAADILKQTPGGAEYIALTQRENRGLGAIPLQLNEAMQNAQRGGLLAGLPYAPKIQSDAALADDRFLYRVADPATRKAMVDYGNLDTDFQTRNPGFKALESGYYALPTAGDARRNYIQAHPELTKGWDEQEALKQRVLKDDGIHPDFARLRMDNAILAGQIPGGVARDQNSPGVRGDRLYFEQWNDKQRAAYDAYQDAVNSPAARAYFDARNPAPEKGQPGYTEFWRANGDRINALGKPYFAALDEIKRTTGLDPQALNNQMRTAKGQPVSATSTSATGGGGGTTARSASGAGGGSSRRSSGGGGSSATALAIAGRDAFYNVFDGLSSREKAALHDVSALDKIFTKGSRPSAGEWTEALHTANRELTTIRDRNTARDSFYGFYDSLTSREKGTIRDLMGIVTDKKADPDDIRRALTTARERLQSGTSDTSVSGSMGGGFRQGQRMITGADVLRYGGFGQAAEALQRAIGSAGSGQQGSRQQVSDAAARYANTFRYPTTSSSSRTTTKKKVA